MLAYDKVCLLHPPAVLRCGRRRLAGEGRQILQLQRRGCAPVLRLPACRSAGPLWKCLAIPVVDVSSGWRQQLFSTAAIASSLSMPCCQLYRSLKMLPCSRTHMHAHPHVDANALPQALRARVLMAAASGHACGGSPGARSRARECLFFSTTSVQSQRTCSRRIRRSKCAGQPRAASGLPHSGRKTSTS